MTSQNGQSLQVDLTKLKNVKCVCGNSFFERCYGVKKIPGLMVGSVQDVMSPIEIYRCTDCKVVLPDFVHMLKEPSTANEKINL